jgi:Na+/citrate or Na+/malate symporter
MKSNKKEWIFYLIVGCGVLLNEIASNFGLQIITFMLTILSAIWAGSKFLSKDESVG